MDKLYLKTISLLEDRKIKNIELGGYLNVSTQTFGNWMIRKKVPAKYARKIADFFNIDVNYLLTDNEVVQIKKVPIVGTASCGNADINHLQKGEYALFHGTNWNKNLYGVIGNGDSMSPEIEDGDQVICDPNSEVLNGDIVHYTIGNESAIKVYVKDEDAFIVQFIPYNANDNFKTKTIRLDDDIADDLKIAKVVAINKIKFNNRNARLRLIGRS